MTKVKICGITNLEDALHCVACGADMLGFNFYEKSRRYIAPHAAVEIAINTPRKIWKVGVFVNMEPCRIDELVEMIGLDAVQIHGDENKAFLDDLRTETKVKIIKAFRIFPNGGLARVANCAADFILLDTFSAGEYGGSGKAFDWTIASELKRRTSLFLAGGLTPENVTAAIRTARPFAVDVASGVESSPGKKDPDKVAKFIDAAKNAL